MEKDWKARVVAGALGMEVVDEEEDDAVAAIPPPQTPLEPMEYLSRSWSVSASEISKILVGGGKKSGVAAATSRLPEMTIPEDSVLATSIVPLPCRQQHVTHSSLDPLFFFSLGLSSPPSDSWCLPQHLCRGMREGIP
jgi:hypothetical protein